MHWKRLVIKTEFTKELKCCWFPPFLKNSRCGLYSTPLFEIQMVAWSPRRYVYIYVQDINHLSETHSTEGTFSEGDTKIVRITQPTNKSPLQYANDLWMETWRCTQVYDKYVLKKTFAAVLPSSIRISMRSFWSNNEHSAPQKLPYEGTSLTNLQQAEGCIHEKVIGPLQ